MLRKLLNRLPIIIWLLLALFMVRAFIFASFVPPWQGSDEPLHYDYIHYLQTDNKLPVLGKVHLCRKVATSLQSFYFGTFKKGSSPYLTFPVNIKEREVQDTNHYNKKFNVNQIVQHPPLYYLIGAILSYPFKDSSLLTSIWFLRMLSAVFGLGVVLLTFLTVDLIFEENKWPAIAAAAFVAINPMFTHVTTTVSNDPLVILLFAIYLFILVKIIRQKITTKRSIYLGLVIGLGMLTKFFFTSALPLTIAAFLLFRKQVWLNTKNTLITIISPIIVSGVYYLRNVSLYGVLQPVYKLTGIRGQFSETSLIKFIYLFNHKLFVSFWSNFGWQQPRFDKSWYIIIFSVVFLSFLGLIVYLVSLYQRRAFLEFKIATLLLSANFFLALILAFYSYKELRLTGFVQGIQGRYFFLLIGLLGLLFYLGIRQLVPFKKGRVAFMALLIFMVALDISAIFYYILPKFYALDGPILFIAIKASERAAQDWFRLGYLYLTSILAYVILLMAILGTAIYEKVKST